LRVPWLGRISQCTEVGPPTVTGPPKGTCHGYQYTNMWPIPPGDAQCQLHRIPRGPSTTRLSTGIGSQIHLRSKPRSNMWSKPPEEVRGVGRWGTKGRSSPLPSVTPQILRLIPFYSSCLFFTVLHSIGHLRPLLCVSFIGLTQVLMIDTVGS